MIIKFKDFKINEDTAVATAGNSNGMGAITAPQPGTIPGTTGSAGSGDIVATGLGTHMVPSLKNNKAYKHIDLLKDMKKKKKKKKKKNKKVKKFNEMYYGNGYYINNCNTCNQILTIKPGDNPDNIYNVDELKQKNLKCLIEWIKKTPEKKITFGNKTNATSIHIDKETFDILIKEFPEKSNI